MTENTQKKILFLLPTTGFGGAELHTLTIAKHFGQIGFTPVLAFPVSEGTIRLYQECVANSIEVIDMPIAASQMATPVENVSEQSTRLRSRLSPNDYEAVVIAAPSPTSAAGLIDCVADMKLPGFCVFHLVPDTLIIPSDTRLAMLRCLRSNFRFVCVSEFSRDMLCQALGVDPADGFIDAIPNGAQVDLPDEPIDLQDIIKNSDARTVVTIGRVHPQKGGRYLIEAIPQVLKSVPEARFIWFGEGPQQQELQEMARRLGVAHALYFAGYTEQSANIMRSADVLALPTLYEGLSLTLLEAMHSGAAIVTTDASYQDRILSDGFDAGISPRADSSALARKIIEVLENPELADRYRSNVKVLAEYYSEERMLGDYQTCLEDLIQQEPPSDASDPEALETQTTWFVVAENQSGEFVISLSDHRPASQNDLGRPLQAIELLAAADSHLSESAALAIAFVFRDSIETLVEPVKTELLSLGSGCSIGGVLLDMTRFDVTHQSTRAFQIYLTVLNAAVEQSDPSILNAIVSKLLAFQDRFDIEPWSSAQHFLENRLSQPARDSILKNLADRTADSLRDDAKDTNITSIARSLDSLSLSRAERALFRAYSLRAQGKQLDAERHFRIHQALTGQSKGTADNKHGNALFFAEHFNYPPTNGGDRRMLSVIQGYQALGFSVHFCGLSHANQTADKQIQTERLREDLGIQAHYIPLNAKTSSEYKQAHREQSLGHDTTAKFVNVSIIGQLRQLAHSLQPKVFHANYCYFAWTAAAVEGLECHRVLDTHDLISRRLTLNRELVRLCAGRKPESTLDIPGAAHVPDRLAALRYNILSNEITQLKQFDTVLMISPDEASLVRPFMSCDSVRTLQMYLPYSPAVHLKAKTPQVRAVFTGGNNTYNLFGAAAIRNHILPFVDAHLDASNPFSVRIAGDICGSIDPHPRLDLLGRIPDIDTAYMNVDFALCPIPAGTGQNVKMVEALSHGIPVIAYSAIGRSANIISGVNGLLVNDLKEMREAVLRLVNDTNQRVELIRSCRQWASKQYTNTNFLNSLQTALVTTGFRFPEKSEDLVCR